MIIIVDFFRDFGNKINYLNENAFYIDAQKRSSQVNRGRNNLYQKKKLPLHGNFFFLSNEVNYCRELVLCQHNVHCPYMLLVRINYRK